MPVKAFRYGFLGAAITRTASQQTDIFPEQLADIIAEQ
jgi:hypothetical protein